MKNVQLYQCFHTCSVLQQIVWYTFGDKLNNIFTNFDLITHYGVNRLESKRVLYYFYFFLHFTHKNIYIYKIKYVHLHFP